jgi:hypothetical protein
MLDFVGGWLFGGFVLCSTANLVSQLLLQRRPRSSEAQPIEMEKV